MKSVKIKYVGPASVRRIIDAKGDGYGVMNTENGLWLNGVTHPKGTVFEVRDGMVEPAEWGVFATIDLLLAAGFEQRSKHFFRRGDIDVRLIGNGAQVTLYSKGNGTALRFSVDAVESDSVAAA